MSNSAPASPAVDRPSFLVVTVDQMRADHAGFAGNPIVRTPNLDAMARNGVALSRAYVNCPLCMPSRASLFTGQTPRGHGVRTNGIPLQRDLPTLPGILSSAGYSTASVGKVHLRNYELYEGCSVDSPELYEAWRSGAVKRVTTPYYGLQSVELTIGHGDRVEGDYARWLRGEHPREWGELEGGAVFSAGAAEDCATFPLPEEYHHTAWVADRTLEFLEGVGDDDFFLMCSFPDPHHPYVAPEPWDRMYDPADVASPPTRMGELDELHPLFRKAFEEDETLSGRRRATRMSDLHRREIIARTYGMVSLIDKHLGRVVDGLERLGLRERTVVVFLSDHGDLMGDHGLLNKGPFHFEGLLRVPFVWSWPGRFPARRSDGLASLLDFVPTVLELAGVDYPDGHGVPEQFPALPGRSLVPVLSGERDSVQDAVVVENDEDYLGLRLRTVITERRKLTTYTGRNGPEPHGELFDLAADPQELHNLWAHEDRTGEKAELTALLHHRLVETDPTVPRRIGHA